MPEVPKSCEFSLFASQIAGRHRYYRLKSVMLSLQSSELATPAPSPGSECCPPLLVQREEHAWGRGGGEPIRTKGQPLGCSRYSIIPLRRQVRNSFVQAEPGMPSLIPRPGTEVRFTPIPRFHTGTTHSIMYFLLDRSGICLFALRYEHRYIGSHICLVFLLLLEEHLVSPVRLSFKFFSIQCAWKQKNVIWMVWFE